MPTRLHRLSHTVLTFATTALLLGCALAPTPQSANTVPADTAAAPSSARVVSIKQSPAYQDPALLAVAWQLPVAALYKASIEYQHNGSVCGPTSVANVLHSLQRPGDQASVLKASGLTTVMGYLPQGITLDQLAEVSAQSTGGHVSVLRDLSLASFREHLRQSNAPARRYIINFTRAPLFGTGGGHHSPIAGYLAEQDLVLVLDVNEQYGAWLVTPERLFEAMDTVDTGAGKKRGLLLID
jgi:hypothetical protein